MLVIAVLLLAGYVDFLKASEDCENDALIECLPPEIFPVPFPETEAEINFVCPKLRDYVHCIQNHLDECGNEDGSFEEQIKVRYEKISEVLSDVCDKGSTLHDGIIYNIKCLKSRILNHNASCYDKTEAVLEIYSNHRHLEETEDINKNSIYWEEYFCLFEAYDLSCLASDAADRCGLKAKNIILEIVKRLHYLENSCSKKAREELRNLIEILNFDVRDKVQLKEMFLNFY
ncbi:uncharacterized protein TNIN_317181 [Trichonephila inaurata madagascariensis]|uniref:Secreted protein n=1 Tax=Trichonephila inaurata madagascariensis TaxID=2747483 RepID=A0A8X6IFU1_9ARAC|nr:uncharacterized protein TNIN_317181 [Trichonephila inaurata madagascariensis]